MIRLLAFIFSFYILALTAMPCIDVPHDETNVKTELTTESSHNHHEENDLCSPFCSCDCCVSPIIHSFTTILLSTSVIAPHLFQDYHSALNSSLFVSIWQPPQLV